MNFYPAKLKQVIEDNQDILREELSSENVDRWLLECPRKGELADIEKVLAREKNKEVQ